MNSSKSQSKNLESQRLDKWLWAARFYKTRQLAGEAVTGGKVHVNGQRSKPGKLIQPGTEIEISKNHHRWLITVVALNAQRRPAKEACLLYEEDPQSFATRQAEVALKRAESDSRPVTERPNKKQRRAMDQFKKSF